MSLDTKYRPTKYSEVLGQEGTVKVLKEFVRQGKGFQQSYLFGGAWGSGKCVVGDTLVPTSKGLIPISELCSEVVLEGSEAFAPLEVTVDQEKGLKVSSAYAYRSGRRATIRVRTYLGFELEGTPNHRVRALDSSGKVVWRHLGEVREGDFLCINRKGSSFGQGCDLSGFKRERRGNGGAFEAVPVDLPATLDQDWGRLLGYLVGDGSCKITNGLEVNNSEDEVKDDVLDIYERLIGASAETPDKRSKTGLSKLRSWRTQAREFLAFAGLGYHGAGGKEIPWSVLQSSREVCRAFLRGYFEADGHVGPGGFEVTSKSKKLVSQVQILLLQFGIVTRLGVKPVPGYGDYWRLTLQGTSRRAFLDLGFVSSRKSRALEALYNKTNIREAIPFQEEWVKRFYKALPKEHRTSATNSLFQCRYYSCRLTKRVLQILVSEYLSLVQDEEIVSHFKELWEADYVYTPVVERTSGEAEVFDLNVPEGEMFSGNGFMNHNTTLARILARALLCESPKEGAPCDECHSCKVMLTNPDSHECFVEVDAATSSGKANTAKIVEELEYNTFSGKKRIYLFDEAHELSRASMDCLLLPMEDVRPNSEDKKLVCIFCTTEPEKMRPAVLSRCAPAFTIRPCTPQVIAGRLAEICTAESMPFEEEALPLIAEVTESHIRDALKTIEGVNMLGGVTKENVYSYLHLDANQVYLEVLDHLGSDLDALVGDADSLMKKVSPATAYEHIANLAVMAYKFSKLGLKGVPSYIDQERLNEVGERHGEFLVEIAARLAKRPTRSNASMFLCDLVTLHQLAVGAVVNVIQTETPISVSPGPKSEPQTPQIPGKTENVGKVGHTAEPYLTSDGRYVDPRAQRSSSESASEKRNTGVFDAELFTSRLEERLQELAEEDGRFTGRNHLGSPGANPAG